VPSLNKSFRLICVLSLLWGVSALASDGVLEINQACAVNGGCFDGDAAGFPVTITQSGSYQLTGNLDLTDVNLTAILITAQDVSLDLGGFTISGPTVCNGFPPSCAPLGSGVGIEASGFNRRNISIKNGTIRGTGSDGVLLQNSSVVEHLRVLGTGGHGIAAGAGSRITASVAEQNAADGISVIAGRALIADCFVSLNGGDGIRVGESGILSGNVMNSNGDDGIDAAAANSVTGNNARSNVGDGIVVGVGSTVIGNTSLLNTGFGMVLSSAGYAQNVIRSNTGGTVSGGVQMGTNVCDDDTSCP
jgi:hypothetical protein